MNLYGSMIPIPSLRFNYSSNYAVSSSPRQGLKQFGPYDYDIFDKCEIRCGIIYPRCSENIKTAFVSELLNGSRYFGGFQKLFRIPLVLKEEQAITDESEKGIKMAINNLINRDLDIFFIITSSSNTPIYRICKAELLANGIPSQVVTEKKLQNSSQRQWILENIALASYAKVGGTPWVVANPIKKNQLVLGVSRVQDKSKRFFVGFVTLFTQDGDFILMHSKAPVIKWNEYIDGLEELITEAINEYENKKGTPEEIIIHFHKRPGDKELEAIENALENENREIPYALLHLNEYSNFRLFDSSDTTFVPESGWKVELSRHESILLLDGRAGDRRRKMGVPKVLDIRIDKRSTLPIDSFPMLIEQIYSFARVNWRGFNAAAIPITLNYSKLIANMAVNVGMANWNQIIASGKLRDKSWFL